MKITHAGKGIFHAVPKSGNVHEVTFAKKPLLSKPITRPAKGQTIINTKHAAIAGGGAVGLGITAGMHHANNSRSINKHPAMRGY